MRVEDNTVVSIRYRMENSRGEVLEDILDGLAISYLHGKGTILKQLELELFGLTEGEEKEIIISNGNGYEDLNDEFHIKVIIDNVRFATEDEVRNGLNPRISDSYCGPEGCC